MKSTRDIKVMGFVGALFSEGGTANIDALRNCGLGDWTLAEVVRIASAAADAGLIQIDKNGTISDAGYWEVSLVGREVERV